MRDRQLLFFPWRFLLDPVLNFAEQHYSVRLNSGVAIANVIAANIDR